MEHTGRSKSRVFIFGLVVALLLFACAAMLRGSIGRDQLEQRLHDTRTAVNDENVAAADSPTEQNIRTQLSAVLSHATVESLDKPKIAAAVVPDWQKELMLYWVAKRPDADAIEIQVESQPPVRMSLPPKDIEANRTESRTRVLYNNTIQLPELERVLTSAPPGAKMTVALVWQGKTVSEPAPITVESK
jgi:hypothetical protein